MSRGVRRARGRRPTWTAPSSGRARRRSQGHEKRPAPRSPTGARPSFAPRSCGSSEPSRASQKVVQRERASPWNGPRRTPQKFHPRPLASDAVRREYGYGAIHVHQVQDERDPDFPIVHWLERLGVYGHDARPGGLDIDVRLTPLQRSLIKLTRQLRHAIFPNDGALVDAEDGRELSAKNLAL